MNKTNFSEDVIYSTFEVLNEGKSFDSPNGAVLKRVKGPLAFYDQVNRNSRKYSKALWESVIKSDYVKELLDNKTFFGEARHPEERMEVSFLGVSHAVRSLYLDESRNCVSGEVDILDTPAGKIINTLIDYGAKIGISARAAGTEDLKDGVKHVNEGDYVFVTFDFDPMPGFEGSRLVMSESLSMAPSLKESLSRQIEEMDQSGRKVVQQLFEKSNDQFYKDVIYKIKELNGRENSPIEESSTSTPVKEEKETEPINETLPTYDSSYKDTLLSIIRNQKEEKGRVEIENSKLKKKVDSLQEKISALQKDQKESIDLRENQIQRLNKKLDRFNGVLERKENRILVNKEKVSLLEARMSKMRKREEINESIREEYERKLEQLRKTPVSQEKIEMYEKLIRSLSNKMQKIEESRSSDSAQRKALEERLDQFAQAEADRVAAHLGLSKEAVLKSLPENFTVVDLREYEAKRRKKKIEERAEKSRKKILKAEFPEREINEGSSSGDLLSNLLSAARR